MGAQGEGARVIQRQVVGLQRDGQVVRTGRVEALARLDGGRAQRRQRTCCVSARTPSSSKCTSTCAGSLSDQLRSSAETASGSPARGSGSSATSDCTPTFTGARPSLPTGSMRRLPPPWSSTLAKVAPSEAPASAQVTRCRSVITTMSRRPGRAGRTRSASRLAAASTSATPEGGGRPSSAASAMAGVAPMGAGSGLPAPMQMSVTASPRSSDSEPRRRRSDSSTRSSAVTPGATSRPMLPLRSMMSTSSRRPPESAASGLSSGTKGSAMASAASSTSRQRSGSSSSPCAAGAGAI